MRDLSLHILDIVQNSIRANAKDITIHIGQTPDNSFLYLEVDDNGIGMGADFLTAAADPFTTTRAGRNTGLGIPLLKEAAIRCQGEFSIKSEKSIGTKVFASFQIGHIDRLPLGDIAGTMIVLISANPDIHFILQLDSVLGKFTLDTDEINGKLDGIGIDESAVLQWLKDYIDEGKKNIFGGVLNEVYG
jgi:signal transduction histidine kinase